VTAEAQFPRPFGRYTLLSNFAQGGMGALYLACQGEAGMEKLCVIKTVLPHLADKEYVARFRDEAKVVVRLSHGNLVPVFDAGLAKVDGVDELYLSMDYVDGKDLRAVWNRCAKRGIAFPVDVAAYIARELARGLHHAHAATDASGSIKLVHRDVSPPNVLVSFAGEVKLTDFGLASSTMKTEKTAPGVVYGKVSYMSPEQARAEPLDGRTDLYAVGIILWELLTGRQLFPQTQPDLLNVVRDPDVKPPSSQAARVPPALDAIVLKALAKDRTLRYADCEAFRAALSGFLAQTAPTTDNDRVAKFLVQLFGDEIEEERRERQEKLDGLADWRARVAQGGSSQLTSKPETVSLTVPKGKVGADLIGQYLDGRYLVKRLIGEGGMGLVYEAEHVDIGRRVAVKLLHAAFTRQSEVVARFRAEARAATRIGHPHIIEVFDSGTTVDGAVYFVMEYLEGRDLSDAIEREGPLPAARVISIGRDICQALAAAHKAGIVHRDMKPENVFLISRDGRRDFVKVLDFGIAKTLDASGDRVGRLTSPGIAMGTPEYMAPEQAAGGTTDHRVDVYALGAIFYEMLCGRPPHEGANIMEVLTRKATEPVRPIADLRPDLPRELERLVMRMLSRDPDHRPQTMDQLSLELGRLGGQSDAPHQAMLELPTDRVEPPRSRRRWIVAGTAAAMLIGAGVWVVSSTNRTPKGFATVRAPQPPANANVSAPANVPVNANVNVPVNVNANANAAPPPVKAEVPTIAKIDPKPKLSSAPTPTVRPPKPKAEPAPAKATAPAATDPLAMRGEAKRLLAEAREAKDAGRYAQAETLFNKVQSTGFERGPAFTGLAEIAFQKGSYPDAVRLGKRAVETGGGLIARMVLGNSYFKLKKYDEAIAEYEEVLKIDGGYAEAQQNLALATKRRSGG
jgi:serine/threonine protein kinase